MKSIRYSFLLKQFPALLLTLTAFGCINKRIQQPPTSPVTAHPKIENSFQISKELAFPEGPIVSADRAKITIRRSALEKEFLLQSFLIPQPGAPLGSAMKSRIVAFRERNTSLYLLEASQGHTVSSELPQTLILTEFPILRSGNENITFDFNSGMSRLFVADDWHTQDDGGSNYNHEKQFAFKWTSSSYIENAKFSASSNQLEIRQIAQVPTNGEKTTYAAPIEMKYYLSPYLPDADFQPVQSKNDFERMGFFEVAPKISSNGTNVVHASKFNHKKPIQFAISSNTPAEFKQAVRDGILYWNKAFGANVVEAIDAPNGVFAPDLTHNIVQWVNWDQAGFAYADAQMDPRTGQILHAQIYMTSFWIKRTQDHARRILRQMATRSASPLPRAWSTSLQGFQKERICDLAMDSTQAAALLNLIDSGITDGDLQKLAEDMIRSVIAHEVGHTLGLRHNFAGSLATNFPLSERAGVVARYLREGSAPAGTSVTSSVMEYPMIEEDLIIGDQIAKLPHAMSYDEKAIQTLYYGKTFSARELPLFCTDSHVEGMFADCRMHDTGSSAVEFAQWRTRIALENNHALLFESFIEIKSPFDGSEPDSIEDAPLPSPEIEADSALAARANLLKALTPQGRLLKIERMLRPDARLIPEKLRLAVMTELESEITRLGGLDSVLGRLPDDYVETQKKKFDALLANQNIHKGIGHGGQEYSLTDSEVQSMKAGAAAFFSAFALSFARKDIALLASVPKDADKELPFDDLPFQLKQAKLLSTRVEHYVLGTTGKKIKADLYLPPEAEKSDAEKLSFTCKTPGFKRWCKKHEPKTTQLPEFRYSQDIRAAAAQLLRPTRAPSLGWGYRESYSLHEKLEKLISETITEPVDELKLEKTTPAVRRWVFENAALLKTLEENATAPKLEKPED